MLAAVQTVTQQPYIPQGTLKSECVALQAWGQVEYHASGWLINSGVTLPYFRINSHCQNSEFVLVCF